MFSTWKKKKVLKPDPPGIQLAQDWNQTGLKKKQGKKKSGVIWQDSVTTRWFFLLKWYYFDLKKNSFKRLGDPVKTRALNCTGSKNYALKIVEEKMLCVSLCFCSFNEWPAQNDLSNVLFLSSFYLFFYQKNIST